MRGLTKEDKEMYDKVIACATIKELIIWALWDIFYPKKREKLHETIKNGMSWHFAWIEAKKVK